MALTPKNMDISQEEYPYFWFKIIFPYLILAIPMLLWIIATYAHSQEKQLKTRFLPQAALLVSHIYFA